MPSKEFISRIEKKYKAIMNEERNLVIFPWKSFPNAKDMYGVSTKALEFAKNGHVQRAFNYDYGLAKKGPAVDSSSSHTNLMCCILDEALSYKFGWDHERLPKNYSYRGIMEATRRLSLPENYIGNHPDNGNRDSAWLKNAEHSFYEYISRYAPSWESEDFEKEVDQILNEIEQRATLIGEIIYLSDKVASIIEALRLDQEGRPPLMRQKDIIASSKNHKEMEICDEKEVKYRFKKGCRASEMWTVDYFEISCLADYDSTGFFTGLLVMATLQCHQVKWYNWRTTKYL